MGEDCHEKIEVYRESDCLCVEAGGDGSEGSGSVPEDGDQRGYVLYCRTQKKYGGLGTNELRKLKQLEEENAQLMRIVADLTLDKTMLQDVLKKKL